MPTEQDTRRRRVGTALVLGFFTLAGLWLLAVVAVDLLDYREASQWPTVAAEVISADIEELPNAADGASAYEIVLRYSYGLGGRVYQSERLRREGAERFTTREAAAEVLNGYLAVNGTTIVIHVNPADPTESVVNIAPPIYLLLFVAFYWAILLVFLVPALRTLRKARSDRS